MQKYNIENEALSFSLESGRTYILSDIAWKQALKSFLPKHTLIFLPKETTLEQFVEKEAKESVLYQKRRPNTPIQTNLLFFKENINEIYLDYCKSNNINVYMMESGFLQALDDTSIPLSIIMSKNGSYSDPTHRTELETTLKTFDFESAPDLFNRSNVNIETITQLSISNYYSDIFKNHSYPEKNKYRILILGTESDPKAASYAGQITPDAIQMIKAARLDYPLAEIIYKPHPLDLAKNLDQNSTSFNAIKNVCDLILIQPVNIYAALKTIDHVYTYASHAGFEALMMGIKVTTFGRPWYAGWGVTRDINPILRRQRQLRVADLFTAAYILHSQYFDPIYWNHISIEDAIQRCVKERTFSYEMNRPQRIAHQIRSLLKNLDDPTSIQHIQSLILEHPDLDFLYIMLSDVYLKQNQPDDAVSLLSNGLNHCPDNSTLYLKRAQARLKNGDFSQATDTDFLSAIQHSLENAELYYQYFAYLWEKSPINEYLFKQIETALDLCISEKKSRSYGKLLLLKASMLAETKQYSPAIKAYREAKTIGTPDRTFFALRCIVQKHSSLNTASTVEMNTFEQLTNNQQKFRELVLAAKGAVCIVGNAPNLIGSGKGKEIDQNRLVIRFNSYNTDYPYRRDYGAKTDIWVRMPFHPYVQRERESGLKLVILTGSNRLYRPYTSWEAITEYLQSGTPVQFFPSQQFYELQNILGAPPTAGLMLCFMLYKIIGPLEPRHYYGLSFSEPQHQPAQYHYSDQQAQSSARHDWQKEADFFKTLIAQPQEANFMHHSQNTTAEFDRVISVSPGLLNYPIYGKKVESVSALKVEKYLEWLQNPEGVEPAAIFRSIRSDQKICILGFGRAKTGQAAIQLADALKAQFRLVEYGLISSMHLPSEKQYNFSLILDNQGIFYDTTSPSQIETILLNDTDIFSTESFMRAKNAIQLIKKNNITKYNNSPNIILPMQSTHLHRILVVDQTAGDNSIIYGQCEKYSFREMLQHALNQPNSEVFLKIHPETVAGAKEGNLTAIQDLLEHPQLHVISEQCNIVSLIKQVDEVYVMTSGVGLEALFLNTPVRCFGVPFYAGWGLTVDMVDINNPRRPLTIYALFSAVFFKYHTFYHPITQQECPIEACLDWIIQQQDKRS